VTADTLGNVDGRPWAELRRATVIRGGVPILDEVSISLAAGEHTAILGPNGSGKSTLIKLFSGDVYPVSRVDEPTPVTIFGRERWNLTELRFFLGIVSPSLEHDFISGSSLGRATAMDAVIASFFGSQVVFLHHMVTAEMRTQALAALQRVGAGNLGGRLLNQMSSGEVRRVMIARALVHRPRVLILDEPTTGLDLVARHLFLEQLSTLAAEGTTLILITHHVEEIIPEIRRVILLSNGRIAADGSPEDVLTSPRLSAVYRSDVQVHRAGRGYELRLQHAHARSPLERASVPRLTRETAR
jgi:iron complex transport system ATP-binding protein